MLIDKIDSKIIEILEVDGRTPNAYIAKKIGVSEGTIRRRLKKLISSDYLQVNGIANLSKIGLESQAIVGIKAEADKIEDIIDQLSKFQEVKWLSEVTGQYDVFCWVALGTPNVLKYCCMLRLSQKALGSTTLLRYNCCAHFRGSVNRFV